MLLVLPSRTAAGGGGFEAWRPLKGEDRANYDWMHEMLYEVVVHSLAYTSVDWKGAQPWAPPSSAIVPPGANRSYAIRLRLAESVEQVSSCAGRGGGVRCSVSRC